MILSNKLGGETNATVPFVMAFNKLKRLSAPLSLLKKNAECDENDGKQILNVLTLS